jgi:hypothetical protein
LQSTSVVTSIVKNIFLIILLDRIAIGDSVIPIYKSVS